MHTLRFMTVNAVLLGIFMGSSVALGQDAADPKEGADFDFDMDFESELEDQDSESDNVVAGDDVVDSDFAWRKVAGQYMDPTSTYSLHGYVDGVYAGKSSDWTTPSPARPQAPGHLLVPNRNNSAFQYDAALILNSSLGAGALMMELHFVSNPSGNGTAGPGGLTIAATEVTASIDIHPTLLTVSGGLFWIPFGIVNRDWLGAEALFTTLPRASAAFPAHWNERGVRFNGAKAISRNFGVNYVATVGNGVHSFNIGGQPSADLNGNKTVVGRVGVFPGLGRKLEIGASYAYGDMRSEENPMLAVDDSIRYGSTLSAMGADVVIKWGKLFGSGYYIRSEEALSSDDAALSPGSIDRQGATGQLIYDLSVDFGFLSAIAPKVRGDWVSVATLDDGVGGQTKHSSAGLSAGVNLYPHNQILRFDDYPFRALFLSLEYHVSRELTGTELDNDRFVARLTGRF